MSSDYSFTLLEYQYNNYPLVRASYVRFRDQIILLEDVNLDFDLLAPLMRDSKNS